MKNELGISESRDKAIRILDEIASILEDQGLEIKCKDLQEQSERQSSIYGTEYYDLEDRITDIIEGN